MTVLLSDYFLWIKAFHLISVTAWMAGLFYLPRLFVYHTEATEKTTKDTLAIMERKLYKMIMAPAMMATIGSGTLLLIATGNYYSPSFHVKFLCVFLLIMFHYSLEVFRGQLLIGSCQKTSRFFRIINEIPTILLIIIIISVVVKPF
ncbi:MAG: protoporphyrinogen oxidase HemJ [Alphaproteobacteria bacterium]|nr:protoporphyrinogen oxidase HemJ [Alphaproteobacteria bacterium]